MLERMGMERRRRALPIIALGAGLAVIAAIAACSDDEITSPPVVGAVAVFKDSTFNFGNLRTFSMPDTIIHIAPLTGVPLDVPRTDDQAILNQVRDDFIARGFTLETNPQTVAPSFVVLVSSTATTNYNAYVNYVWFPDWGFYAGWNWYAPGFDNTWTIVYPWFPIVGVTAYDRGSLFVQLIPTTTINPLAKSFTSAWVGASTALLNGAVTPAVATAAVDSMFALSPYLVPVQPQPLGSRAP
jgi:hypothetical protein